MPTDSITLPEPQEIDETRSMELRVLSSKTALRASPRLVDEQCQNCRYFLENTADISYCWHPALRMLVGADWSCVWWEPRSEA